MIDTTDSDHRTLTTTKQTDGPALAHYARLLFLSYRYSQGGIGTQNRLLLAIEDRFHPDLFNPAHCDELIALTKAMVGPYFLNQRTHPATAIPWEDEYSDSPAKPAYLVTNELNGLFDRFRDRSELAGFDGSAAGIAASMITMDLDYLSRDGGRAGDSRSLMIKVSPYRRDPYESLFVSHSIIGRTTRSSEYDSIFSSLAKQAVLNEMDEYTLTSLLLLIRRYSQHHPESAKGLSDFAGRCERKLNGQ